MTHEEFEQRRSEMTDETLIALSKVALSDLCRTGGKSFTMCVPPKLSDTDILFSELINRYKNACISIKQSN